LRAEILTFYQNEKESINAAWARLSFLAKSGPDLSLPDHLLLQHLYMDFSKENAQYLDDEDIATNDTSTPTPVSILTTPLGPITRARARRLTHQVSSLLSSGSSYLDNGDTCTLVLLRNNGLDQKARSIAQADSDYRTNTTCDGRHDFIQTLFWSFEYFLESLSNLLSKGSRMTSISVRSDLLQSPFEP
jgi:hypothetical protein